MKQALLSIVIPTKDRYETLIPVVNALLQTIQDDRVELVLQDNSAQPQEWATLSAALGHDPRVTYAHVGGALSIVANTVAAIQNSSGKFLIFIGDDDLVSPYVMHFVDWMEAHDCEAITYNAARYWWSTVKFDRETVYHRPGAFWLMQPFDATARRVDAASELRRILSIGGVNYGELPRFYHGIVSRAALERVRERAGTYVPGASPDMAFSAALALVMRDYLWVDYPISVFGAARNSGGGMTAAGRHYGKLEEQRHLPRETVEHWDPLLPRVWSELTIYPQTLREVGEKFKEDLTIDYDVFYASALVTEPHIWPHVKGCVRRYYRAHPARLLKLAVLLLKKTAGRAKRAIRASRRGMMNCELHHFDQIGDAARFLAQPSFKPDLSSLTAAQK